MSSHLKQQIPPQIFTCCLWVENIFHSSFLYLGLSPTLHGYICFVCLLSLVAEFLGMYVFSGSYNFPVWCSKPLFCILEQGTISQSLWILPCPQILACFQKGLPVYWNSLWPLYSGAAQGAGRTVGKEMWF